MTSAENGDIENVILALTSGANVTVHNGGYDKVSTMINSNKLLLFVSIYILK